MLCVYVCIHPRVCCVFVCVRVCTWHTLMYACMYLQKPVKYLHRQLPWTWIKCQFTQTPWWTNQTSVTKIRDLCKMKWRSFQQNIFFSLKQHNVTLTTYTQVTCNCSNCTVKTRMNKLILWIISHDHHIGEYRGEKWLSQSWQWTK